MEQQKITGATHPLTRRILDADRAHQARRIAAEPIAAAILADHRAHGTSDQTLYDVSNGTPAWRRIGPVEHHGQAATQAGHIVVSGRDSVATIVDRIVGSGRTRAHELRDAAQIAAPMASVLLALRIAAGGLEWDTDETLTQAGLRLALTSSEHLLGQPNPARPTPADIYAEVARAIQMAPAGWEDASAVARWWLDEHVDATARLAAAGITWGTSLLDTAASADRAGVARPTWAAYTSRGEAPAADAIGPNRWLPATVDAWRLLRPRAAWLAWSVPAGSC